MYFDNISNLRKAAQTHFAYRSMGTASGWPDCWGGWGCKETFFFRKNQNMKFFNDIQHKPIENCFFGSKFKCMYDTVSETIAEACFVIEYCKYLIFKSHKSAQNYSSEFPSGSKVRFYFSVIASNIFDCQMLLRSVLSLKRHRNVSKSSPLLLRSSILHIKQIVQ